MDDRSDRFTWSGGDVKITPPEKEPENTGDDKKPEEPDKRKQQSEDTPE